MDDAEYLLIGLALPGHNLTTIHRDGTIDDGMTNQCVAPTSTRLRFVSHLNPGGKENEHE